MDPTERILQQGKALVRAIEALETIEPTGPIERVQTRYLLHAYGRWLRAIVGAAALWLALDVLSPSQACANHWEVGVLKWN